ncbi:MAG: hypothetical protein P4L44_09845 [Oryzomonas sp.]|nr:hypothetical protein [Oryzomonas sp.]MDR3580251.1 hypothetical protein [Oryzomonas sp.]
MKGVLLGVIVTEATQEAFDGIGVHPIDRPLPKDCKAFGTGMNVDTVVP